jgi:hypothetical protein
MGTWYLRPPLVRSVVSGYRISRRGAVEWPPSSPYLTIHLIFTCGGI